MTEAERDIGRGGAGPAVVQVAVQVTRHVLNVAVECGALRANPALALRLPKSVAGEKLFLSPGQVLPAELIAH